MVTVTHPTCNKGILIAHLLHLACESQHGALCCVSKVSMFDHTDRLVNICNQQAQPRRSQVHQRLPTQTSTFDSCKIIAAAPAAEKRQHSGCPDQQLTQSATPCRVWTCTQRHVKCLAGAPAHVQVHQQHKGSVLSIGGCSLVFPCTACHYEGDRADGRQPLKKAAMACH